MILNPDNREKAIVENISSVLSTLQSGNPLKNVFHSVQVVDDVDSFLRINDVTKEREGASAGIVVGRTDRGPGTDGTEEATFRLPIRIIIRFMQIRKAGADEKKSVDEMSRLTHLVRESLRADLSRGGNCSFIIWQRKYLNGTDVDGVPLMPRQFPNQGFFSVQIPVFCGWYKPKA